MQPICVACGATLGGASNKSTNGISEHLYDPTEKILKQCPRCGQTCDPFLETDQVVTVEQLENNDYDTLNLGIPLGAPVELILVKYSPDNYNSLTSHSNELIDSNQFYHPVLQITRDGSIAEASFGAQIWYADDTTTTDVIETQNRPFYGWITGDNDEYYEENVNYGGDDWRRILHKFDTYVDNAPGNKHWERIGGTLYDNDYDTKVTTESSRGANENEISFFTSGIERAVINNVGKEHFIALTNGYTTNYGPTGNPEANSADYQYLIKDE